MWTPTEVLPSLRDGSKKTTERDVLAPVTIASNPLGSRDVTDAIPIDSHRVRRPPSTRKHKTNIFVTP